MNGYFKAPDYNWFESTMTEMKRNVIWKMIISLRSVQKDDEKKKEKVSKYLEWRKDIYKKMLRLRNS